MLIPSQGKTKQANTLPDIYLRREQFHVDNLSSAHVYVRLSDGETWDDMPKPLLEDCAQLTKANSIEGEQNSLGDKTSF